MKKYIVTVNWNHGFIHEYEVIGGEIGSRSDAVQDAKDHLNSARNISSYIIKDEDGNIVYEHGRDQD